MISVISVIAGFQDPTSGDVLLEGKSLLAVPSHKRNIGMSSNATHCFRI